MKKNQKGFTLIELLIVIGIIALLATLAIVSLSTAQAKARDTKRLADIKSIQNAVELYYSEKATYPTPATWAAFGTALSDADAMDAMPVAPNKEDAYTYWYRSDGTNYCLMTSLEKSNQALEQDVDTDDCSLTLSTTAISYDSPSTPGDYTHSGALDCDGSTANYGTDSGDAPHPYCIGS